ncbi:LysE family transporter [uncultured Pantoea sp.]|uniref:LysE family translocator n=1 Tax=uncultured Pantoea sp. TaxID=218084 RepID=UPI0027D99A0C|nr:LysE family transporter [uncultured Pantoea sp.]
MLDIVHFLLFLASVVLLCITPGPDLAYVVGQSVARGRQAGVLSASGVALGSCTHAVASALGLTALIAASPLLFTVIKYTGAAYLIYLGTKMIVATFRVRHVVRPEGVEAVAQTETRQLLLRGFITSITNPKVLLFFIAFFPQFVTVEGDHHAVSFLLLGLAYALTGLITDVLFALLAGGAAGAVAKNQTLQKALDRVVGATFIGLGIRLALTRR